MVPELERTRPGAASRLPEVLGYLGGTFVVAAALIVVGWSWDSFSHAAKLTVSGLAALVVYGAGLTIALAAAGGRATLTAPSQDVRRRLVGVLLVVGAFIAAGAVDIALEDMRDDQLLPVALTALALTALAVHLAPGTAPTLGLFTATVMLAATPAELRSDVPDLAWILIFLGLGALWVAVGPALTRTPIAALVVGLGDLVVAGWVASEHTVYEADAFVGSEQQWGDRVVAPLGYAVLAMLTILGVALYLRGRAWPWLAAATGLSGRARLPDGWGRLRSCRRLAGRGDPPAGSERAAHRPTRPGRRSAGQRPCPLSQAKDESAISRHPLSSPSE